jgi:hydrogenase nickel incorporation protein HypA/HybF
VTYFLGSNFISFYMHELSIALGIVKIAETETAKAKANKVDVIELEIGTLAGIEFDSLDFVWPAAVKETVLENAIKRINIIKGKGKCLDCDTTFDIINIYDSCPNCKSFLKGIIQGKELKVKALEVS